MDNVNGIERVHFVHEPSADQDAIPLLLLHGWPGSYFEFYKMIGKLARPGETALLVICMPS